MDKNMPYKKEQRQIFSTYVLVSGLQDGKPFEMDDFAMVHAETLDGHYIGDPKTAEMLVKGGIIPELISPEHKVCSIGFCELEQKWYGWSHRAMYGFGIGYVAKEGDVVTESGWIDGIDPRTGKPDDKVLPVGFEVKSLDDAKRAAIAFASGVS